MVVTIKETITNDYTMLIKDFDFCVSIGNKKKMVIRPMEKSSIIDGIEDGFTFYQSIQDVWLLVKGYTIKGAATET